MSVDVEFRLTVKCQCGEDLSDQVEAEGLTRYCESTVIRVKPCEKCMEKEREAGREEAEEEAKNDAGGEP